MSDKKFENGQEKKKTIVPPGVPWQAFLVSSNESTGMIPAIFSDEMMDSYGSLYEGLNVFPDLNPGDYKRDKRKD